MGLRVAGNADLEIGDPLDARHQLGGIREAVGVRHVQAPRRWIAAQRHDVPHACRPIAPQQVLDLAAALADAGQVRGRPQMRLGEDARDGLEGLVLGAATRAVGDET